MMAKILLEDCGFVEYTIYNGKRAFQDNLGMKALKAFRTIANMIISMAIRLQRY